MTRKLMFIGIGVICAISIGIVIFILVFRGQDEDFTDISFSNNNYIEDEQIAMLEEEFNNIFNNKLNQIVEYNDIKLDIEQELVYSKYVTRDHKSNEYDLNINIPNININTEQTNYINEEILSIFLEKAKKVITKTDGIYTVYNVEYTSYINGDILSLIIRSTLKEGTNAQRIIVQTYNYNLKTHQKINLDEALNLKQIDKEDANKKIKEKIKNANDTAVAMKEAGYDSYMRNLDDEIYNVSNMDNYFLGKDSYLYIVYAYGNREFTSSMDLIIFK